MISVIGSDCVGVFSDDCLVANLSSEFLSVSTGDEVNVLVVSDDLA